MSRGLGHWQSRIIEYIGAAENPVLTRELLVLGLGLELPVEASVYSAIRRAIASLVNKGTLRKSNGGMRKGQNAYWLPGQPGVEAHRRIPLAVVKRAVLKELGEGEKPYADVASKILHHIDGNDPAVRTAITRAVKALEHEGRILRATDSYGSVILAKSCKEMESCFCATLT